MDEEWGSGDLVKLFLVKKDKYELHTEGWVGLPQVEKMERQCLRNKKSSTKRYTSDRWGVMGIQQE